MFCHRSLVALLVLSLGVAGCGRPKTAENSLTALDNELVDSAAAGAPQGRGSADSPARTEIPAAEDCRSGGRSGGCRAAEMVHAPGCGDRFALGLVWATRLPAGLELYPGAKVIEAAGNDEGSCHMRIVSYVSDASPKELVDWYQAAAKAGYDIEHQRHGQEDVVAGTREPQGDAFHATIAPDAAGSTVDLIVNHGS